MNLNDIITKNYNMKKIDQALYNICDAYMSPNFGSTTGRSLTYFINFFSDYLKNDHMKQLLDYSLLIYNEFTTHYKIDGTIYTENNIIKNNANIKN